MTNRPRKSSPRDKIAALSDSRLQALAFNAWRYTQQNKNKKMRERALRLTPLFRAELRLRNLHVAGPDRKKA